MTIVALGGGTGLPAVLDDVVTHTTKILPGILARYAARGARPVDPDFAPTNGSPAIVRADLLEAGPVVRHAPDKLGPILCDLAFRRSVGAEEVIWRPQDAPVS